jgi:hypothetical protein
MFWSRNLSTNGRQLASTWTSGCGIQLTSWLDFNKWDAHQILGKVLELVNMVEAEMLEQQNDDGRSRLDDQLKEASAGECDHGQLHNVAPDAHLLVPVDVDGNADMLLQDILPQMGQVQADRVGQHSGQVHIRIIVIGTSECHKLVGVRFGSQHIGENSDGIDFGLKNISRWIYRLWTAWKPWRMAARPGSLWATQSHTWAIMGLTLTLFYKIQNYSVMLGRMRAYSRSVGVSSMNSRWEKGNLL